MSTKQLTTAQILAGLTRATPIDAPKTGNAEMPSVAPVETPTEETVGNAIADLPKHMYVAETAPSLRIRLGDTRYVFKDKALTLTDEAHAAELDRLIATKPSVSQLIRKLDHARALAVAEAHKQRMAQMRAGSVGPMTSDIVNLMKRQTLDVRDATLEAQGGVDVNSPEAQAALHDVALTTRA